jgi:hypothetical protein
MPSLKDENHAYKREVVVKIAGWFLVAAAGVYLCSCASSGINLSKDIPPFTPAEGQANIVIIRGTPSVKTAYNADKTAFIFVDGIFKAPTLSSTVVIIPVDPGEHYIVGKIDNYATIKLNCAAGKAYFLFEETYSALISAPTPGSGAPSGGLTRVNNSLKIISDVETKQLLEKTKDGFSVATYAGKNKIKNMDPSEIKRRITAYEFWAQQNAEQSRKHIEYPGY